MKKTKILVYALLAILAPVLMSSCSPFKSDTDKLLETVPQDALFVAVINIEDILKSSDASSIDDVIPAKAFGDRTDKVRDLFGSDGGLKLKSAVMFVTEEDVVLTMLVDDEKKLKHALEELDEDAPSVKKKNKFYTYGDEHIIFNEKQVWFINKYKSGEKPSVSDIKEYASLKKDKSIVNLEGFSDMIDTESDMCMLVNIQEFLSMPGLSQYEKEKVKEFNKIMASVGDDISYIAANVDYSGDRMDIVAKLYNSKGEAAKSNMKMGKIDGSQLMKYMSDGDLIVAAAFDNGYVSKILNILEDTGWLSASEKEMFAGLSGTSAFTLPDITKSREFAVMVGTKDHDNAMMLLNDTPYNFGEVTEVDGNVLCLATPGARKNQLPENIAGMFQDRAAAFYFKTDLLRSLDYAYGSFDEQNLELRVVVKCKDGKTFLKLIDELSKF